MDFSTVFSFINLSLGRLSLSCLSKDEEFYLENQGIMPTDDCAKVTLLSEILDYRIKHKKCLSIDNDMLQAIAFSEGCTISNKTTQQDTQDKSLYISKTIYPTGGGGCGC